MKYTKENLVPAFLKAATFRDELIKLGFTDNGGAIHSAERILNILGQTLKYPRLAHINKYKEYEGAEFSIDALKAYEKDERIFIEHVSPIRDFTRKAIALVEGKNDIEARELLQHFVENKYRLVLLTLEETKSLNKVNRSKMTDNRLAGITIVRKPAV